MRFGLIAILSLVAAMPGADAPPLPASLSSLIPNHASVTFHRHPSDEGIVVAYREDEIQWWGRVEMYHHTGDKIDWTFTFPQEYEEWRGHYLVRCRWIQIEQIASPVLELVESTHMGNGSVFLFEITDRSLRLLLREKVRGRCREHLEAFGFPERAEVRFEGEHLSIDYQILGDENADSVVLTGRIGGEDIGGTTLPTMSYRRVCRWDAQERIFESLAPTSP